jgi:hypothetical protein
MGGTISLDAIAIVVVGGTSLMGGEGAIWRTAVGLLMLATPTNLFDSLTVSASISSSPKAPWSSGGGSGTRYLRAFPPHLDPQQSGIQNGRNPSTGDAEFAYAILRP